MEISSETIKVIVKPNSKKSRMLGFDKEKEAYRVEIKAPAEKGKANMELVRFFSRLTKKRARIIKGLKSKEKVLRFS